MACHRRFAYTAMVTILAIVPAWGCSEQGPAYTPPEVKEQIEEGGTKVPEIELPEGTEGTPTDTPEEEDSNGSE